MPSPTALEDPAAPGGVMVPPSSRRHLAVRLVLLVALLVGLVLATRQPVERSVDELLVALEQGQVTTLTIERPSGATVGSYTVRWTGSGRPGVATYLVDTAGAGGMIGNGVVSGDVAVDEGEQVLETAGRSPRDVVVREVGTPLLPTTPTWLSALAIGTGLGVFVLLALGPQPRLGTRWAWLWLLLSAWPLALAFLVLEPTPVWGRRTLVGPRRPLGGGWALLLGLMFGPLLVQAVQGS